MSEHYYSQKPKTKSDPKTWTATLRNNELTFTSDSGVFSKDGVDFGTRLLIDMFQFPDSDAPILDVGCGYGTIGLTLAKENPSRVVVMVDVNERAVHLTRQNAEQNGISNVEIYESDLFENVPRCRFSAIVTNPPIRAGKQVVHRIFEEASERMFPGGELWVVIQKKQGAASAVKKLESIYDKVSIKSKKKGYTIILAQKV
jgi:16S rRNA (guanine1207-N2)-methyltransferase